MDVLVYVFLTIAHLGLKKIVNYSNSTLTLHQQEREIHHPATRINFYINNQ